MMHIWYKENDQTRYTGMLPSFLNESDGTKIKIILIVAFHIGIQELNRGRNKQ